MALSIALPSLCVCTYDFEPEQEDELAMNTGDNIMITEAIDDDWLVGKNVITGAKGILPYDFIKTIPASCDQKEIDISMNASYMVASNSERVDTTSNIDTETTQHENTITANEGEDDGSSFDKYNIEAVSTHLVREACISAITEELAEANSLSSAHDKPIECSLVNELENLMKAAKEHEEEEAICALSAEKRRKEAVVDAEEAEINHTFSVETAIVADNKCNDASAALEVAKKVLEEKSAAALSAEILRKNAEIDVVKAEQVHQDALEAFIVAERKRENAAVTARTLKERVDEESISASSAEKRWKLAAFEASEVEVKLTAQQKFAREKLEQEKLEAVAAKRLADEEAAKRLEDAAKNEQFLEKKAALAAKGLSEQKVVDKEKRINAENRVRTEEESTNQDTYNVEKSPIVSTTSHDENANAVTSPAKEKLRARAIFAYEVEEDDELSFKKGDFMTVIKRIDNEWLLCSMNSKIGLVASNFVVIENTVSSPNAGIVTPVACSPLTTNSSSSSLARNEVDFFNWEEPDVVIWLEQQGFGEFSEVFEDNNVTGPVLVEIDHDMLKDMDIMSIGKRVKLLKAIDRLRHPECSKASSILTSSNSNPVTPTNTAPLPPPAAPLTCPPTHAAPPPPPFNAAAQRKVVSRSANVAPRQASTPPPAMPAPMPPTMPAPKPPAPSSSSNSPVELPSNSIISSNNVPPEAVDAVHNQLNIQNDATSAVSPDVVTQLLKSLDGMSEKQVFAALEQVRTIAVPETNEVSIQQPEKVTTECKPAGTIGEEMGHSTSSLNHSPSGKIQVHNSIVERSTVSGWLTKLVSGSMSKSWKRLWFVLKDMTLYYYKNPNDTTARGMIPLPGYTIAPISKKHDKIDKKWGFKATHGGTNIFYFSSENKDDMVMWMNAMSLAALAESVVDETTKESSYDGGIISDCSDEADDTKTSIEASHLGYNCVHKSASDPSTHHQSETLLSVDEQASKAAEDINKENGVISVEMANSMISKDDNTCVHLPTHGRNHSLTALEVQQRNAAAAIAAKRRVLQNNDRKDDVNENQDLPSSNSKPIDIAQMMQKSLSSVSLKPMTERPHPTNHMPPKTSGLPPNPGGCNDIVTPPVRPKPAPRNATKRPPPVPKPKP